MIKNWQYSIYILALIVLSGCSVLKKNGKKQLSDKEKFEYDYYFFNGQKEKVVGNYELAAQYFQQCINMYPPEPQPYFDNALIFDIVSQKELALEFAQQAYEKRPDNYYYATFYAQLLQENQDYDEAIKVLSDAKKYFPDRLEIYFALAHNYILKSDYKKAIDIYNQIEAQKGISEQVSMQKQRLYTQLNEWDKAENEIKKLIETFPDNTKYYGLLADLYAAQGKDEKALEMYREVLTIDHDDPYIHLSLADYYRQKQQIDSSYKHLELAFYNPDLDVDTKMQILLSFYTISENNDKYKQQAYHLIDIAKEIHPKEAKIYTIYGDYLYRDKKLQEALAAYKKAVELEPEHFDIWSQIMFIEADLKKYNQLQIDAEKALELFPNQPLVYYFYASAAVQSKAYDQAIEYLKTGLDYIQNNNQLKSQFYALLGDAYYGKKELSQAFKYYDKSLELVPDNVYVLNNYAYYLSLENKNLEKAAEMAKFANQLSPGFPSYEDTYGWVLYQLNKFEEAEKWLKKAIDDGGSKNGVILEHYGDVLFKLGKTDEALKYWKKAKETGKASENIDKKINNKQL